MAKRKASRKPAADTAANSSSAGDLHDSHAVGAEVTDTKEPGDRSDTATRSISAVREPTEEDIRTRAYHRFLERGAGHGGHFEDWLAAEQELKAGKKRSGRR